MEAWRFARDLGAGGRRLRAQGLAGGPLGATAARWSTGLRPAVVARIGPQGDEEEGSGMRERARGRWGSSSGSPGSMRGAREMGIEERWIEGCGLPGGAGNEEGARGRK